MFHKRRDLQPEVQPSEIEDPTRPKTIDAETGLGNHRQMNDLLRREIARGMRYGDRSALTVFDVRVAGFRPTTSEPEPPSPARFVADVLVREARESDVVCRIDLTHFAVFLTEADAAGGELFVQRVRTAVSRSPYARNVNGSGIYARAWAGCVGWDPNLATPAAYLAAAMDSLETARAALHAQESYFAGRAS